MTCIKLSVALALIALAGCHDYQKFHGPELKEQGEVYETCFVPKGHGSDVAVGFSTSGNTTWTPIDIKIPARYAIVFKCQHGKFIIDGDRAEQLYKKLSKGDTVTIRYSEVFEVLDGVTNAVDLHFIDADVIKKTP